MNMFTIGCCGFLVYAGIALILSMMDNSNIRQNIINGTAWVGYTLLIVCVIASILMLLF